MKLNSKHQKTKCPSCGSKEIFTQGADQICLDCPWDNAALLVQLGQMDHPKIAFAEQFLSSNAKEQKRAAEHLQLA